MVKATPSWKGAPLFEDKEAGWSFKPRGRIQYDAGYVANPRRQRSSPATSASTPASRRIRLGAEGTIPGGFGYKFEMDFANGSVGFGDVILTYAPKDMPLQLRHRQPGDQQRPRADHQLALQSASSSAPRSTTRSSTPAASALNIGYANKAGDFRVNAGLFAAHSIDSSLDNDGWIGAARAVYSPLMGGNQLHFGANFQHREFQSNNGATVAASAGAAVDQPAGPLSRPAVHPAHRRPLRRHRQFRRQERQYHRPRSRGHLQVAARRRRRPVSEGQRL